MVDTGAMVSALPKTFAKNIEPTNFKLYAANKTPIKTHGLCQLQTDFNLGRKTWWKFYIADISQPILGADFLGFHKLLVDIDGQAIIDKKTGKSTSGSLSNDPGLGLYAIDEENPSEFENIVSQFPEILGIAKPDNTAKTRVAHHILTTGSPVSERCRRLGPEKHWATKEELDFLLKMKWIRRSSSPWASPIHHTPKKNGTWRMVGDYRRLNSVTVPDRYAIPNALDFVNILHGKKIFSTIDLELAYQQIPMAADDIQKTAIITPFGTFEYLVMPFGLKGAGQTFQRYIDEALSGLNFVFAYIDDIFIASTSAAEHKVHLKIVCERLKQYGLLIQKQKCVLGKPQVEYLGYLVNKNGISPLPEKVKVIKEFPKPTTVIELQRFLGMINFYRRSLPNAAAMQIPFGKYIANSKKNDRTLIDWTAEAEEAFQRCKESLANAALLAHPSPNGQIR